MMTSPSESRRRPAASNNHRRPNNQLTTSTAPFGGLADETWLHIFSFQDVKTLCSQQCVCRQWKTDCIRAIVNKQEHTELIFTSSRQLRRAAHEYYTCRYGHYTMKMAERVARKYGWFISFWNVSQIQDFSKLFKGLWKFADDLSMWDVSNGINFSYMFQEAIRFAPPSLANWNMANAKDISYMFSLATQFNGDITGWNTENVVNAQSAFCQARSFNQDISGWNTNKLVNMMDMFREASSFQQDLSAWANSESSSPRFRMGWTHVRDMFSGSGLTQETVSTWDGWNPKATKVSFGDFGIVSHGGREPSLVVAREPSSLTFGHVVEEQQDGESRRRRRYSDQMLLQDLAFATIE